MGHPASNSGNTADYIDANLEATEREATIAELLDLPVNHSLVLTGITGWTRGLVMKQSETRAEVYEALQNDAYPDELQLDERTIRRGNVLDEVEDCLKTAPGEPTLPEWLTDELADHMEDCTELPDIEQLVVVDLCSDTEIYTDAARKPTALAVGGSA